MKFSKNDTPSGIKIALKGLEDYIYYHINLDCTVYLICAEISDEMKEDIQGFEAAEHKFLTNQHDPPRGGG